jgi:hypothetical protein
MENRESDENRDGGVPRMKLSVSGSLNVECSFLFLKLSWKALILGLPCFVLILIEFI